MAQQSKQTTARSIASHSSGCMGRIGDKSFSSKSPALTGSSNVLINNRPALRIDDIGAADWKATSGSSHVLINGRRAHRLNDGHSSSQLVQGSKFTAVGEGRRSVESKIRGHRDIFDVNISLGRHEVFTPLKLPDKRGRPGHESINFRIELKNAGKVDKLTAEVVHHGTVIWSETIGTNLTPSTYEWTWDGYDSAGVLRTARFKDGSLYARAIAYRGPEQRQDILFIHGVPEAVNWVDATVDRTLNSVSTEVRVDFRDGGSRGHADKCRLGGYGTHIIPHQDLLRMALEGIDYHWSRTILHDSIQWAVATSARAQKKDAFKYLALMLNHKEKLMRSWNPRGNWLGNFLTLFVKARVVYNCYDPVYPGFWGNDKSILDTRFRMDTAHEFGHIVLLKGRGMFYSWTHKGSTTLVSQDTHAGTPQIPSTGEIDLMKYYQRLQANESEHLRTLAAEEEVKMLIWLSRIHIDQYRNPWSG